MEFPSNRKQANSLVSLELLGLDHPFVTNQLRNWQSLPPDEQRICGQSPDGRQCVLSVWRLESRDAKGRNQLRIVSIACGTDGARIPTWENKSEDLSGSSCQTTAALHEVCRLIVHDHLGGITTSSNKLLVTLLLKDMDVGWNEVRLLDQIHRSCNGTRAKTVEINPRTVRMCTTFWLNVIPL